MMGINGKNNKENVWGFLWRVSRAPRQHFKGSPLAQSAAAVGVNFWLLWIAVLGQIWVFGSAPESVC